MHQFIEGKIVWQPHAVIRLAPGVHRTVTFPPGADLSLVRRQVWRCAILDDARCCLVLAPGRCVYFEPDGSTRASDKPPAGFEVPMAFEEWRSLWAWKEE